MALTVDDLHASYGRTSVLRGTSFQVEEGGIYAICGPNGVGKSTLLRALVGQVPNTHGSVLWEGRQLVGTKTPHILRHGIALCPEGRRVFPRMTTRENLEIGGYTRRDRASLAEEMDEFLSLWPVIGRRADSPAGLLSGGEQQILAIGRALMSNPRLLLLDEPSLGLAPVLIDQVYAGLSQVARARQISVVLVEQNVAKALELCDTIAVLRDGRLVFTSPSSATTADEVGSHYFKAAAG